MLDTQTGMEHGPSGLRSEDEYFQILRNRILECICEKALRDKNLQWFHGIDMVGECARGFFDQKTADKYQFSDEQTYYHHVLPRIYRPLVQEGLLVENENNTFTIPQHSRLREICGKQLVGKVYIEWEDFMADVRALKDKDAQRS